MGIYTYIVDLLITVILMVNEMHLKACSLLIAVIITPRKRKFSDHLQTFRTIIVMATNTGIDFYAVLKLGPHNYYSFIAQTARCFQPLKGSC